MSEPLHPDQALFPGERPFPVIPVCEHFAGSEKLIRKAFALQEEIGPVFDVTCDCEDGAPAGREREHAEMVAELVRSAENRHRMAGVRIHDATHPAWRQDVEIVVGAAGSELAYITLPKATRVEQVREQIGHIREVARRAGIEREIPIHVLVETHGALRDVSAIAAEAWVQVIDFGLMDFVSGHHGAIPAAAMRSPGQFEHRLLVRAKAEVVAAALAHGRVPAHNVTLDLRNPYQTYQDAWRARHEFGFLRMWSIYPAQIRPIVDAMKPDHAEVQEAAAILLAAREAHWGPIQHAGELHDRATYRYYWEVLKKARVTGVPIPAEAEAAFFA
ncbi:HpcH/HpaI aldolase/citrate lyase family protein [Inmirania thermothiophila]|uniref:Citrate lyase subunit beta/citryl-CoA lyase n=1 Tax=Inmirania thermothiophila TaxID=1750597 RepID=A0A3N1Y2M6_9GAMM|nr:aldolase/citrate lyase family protein [Inmirania thermothiophila]ROR32768.1 citrate lyase subunit beta/citryl-CoA lyase [Inmirania thermothiophila]